MRAYVLICAHMCHGRAQVGWPLVSNGCTRTGCCRRKRRPYQDATRSKGPHFGLRLHEEALSRGSSLTNWTKDKVHRPKTKKKYDGSKVRWMGHLESNGFPGFLSATQDQLVPLALSMYEEIVRGAPSDGISPVGTMSAAVKQLHMLNDLNQTNPFIHTTVTAAIQRLRKVCKKEAPPVKHATRLTDVTYERLVYDCMNVCTLKCRVVAVHMCSLLYCVLLLMFCLCVYSLACSVCFV